MLPTNKKLYKAIISIIETAKGETAEYVNAKISLLYWNIGDVINSEILQNKRADYGSEIIATLSQQLSYSHFVALAVMDDQIKETLWK